MLLIKPDRVCYVSGLEHAYSPGCMMHSNASSSKWLLLKLKHAKVFKIFSSKVAVNAAAGISTNDFFTRLGYQLYILN